VLFQAGFATLALVSLLLAVRNRRADFDPLSWQPRIGQVLVWSGFLFFLFGNTGYGEHREALLPLRLLTIPFLAVYFLAHEAPSGTLIAPVYRARRVVFHVLIVVAIAFRVAVPYVSPDPRIDVYWFTNQGAAGILEGVNPYDRAFHIIDPKSETLYAYLPGQFLFDSPAVALFGDMRWGQMILELAAAWMMYAIVMGESRRDERRHSAELVALLLLFFPQVLRMQEQSWVEFKQVFALTLFVWLLSRAPRSWKPWPALGLLFSLKQTTWAAWPFLVFLKPFSVKRAFLVAGTMAIIILPFLLWNPYAFFDDIVLYHVGLELPGSTSISQLFVLMGKSPPSLGVLAVLGLGALGYLWFFSTRNLIGFLLASTALGMVPVLMRQAFLNYYYYLDGGVLLTMAWLLRREHDRMEGRAEVDL